MYHPYLRGKQFELLLLKENAETIASSNFTPIIEPVKKNTASLNRAIDALKDQNSNFIIIVNPKHGDFKNNSMPIFDETITPKLQNYQNCYLGYIIDSNSSLIDITNFIDEYEEYNIALIHNGYTKAKELSNSINGHDCIRKHIFIDQTSGKLYQREFKKGDIERILIRDGFNKSNSNREYPDTEHFSDLHITYIDEGMDGFGDFLIVGNNYSESGGPAYAIAIHISYLEDDQDMYIYHFLSDRMDSPADPAGKFNEALNKFINTGNEPDSLIYKSNAYEEFEELFNTGHFPGLGYVKKLSMQHHLELMSSLRLTE